MSEGNREETDTQKQMKDYNDQWQQMQNQKSQLNTGQFSYNNYYWPYHHNCRPRRYCPYCGQLLDGWGDYWSSNNYMSSTQEGHIH